MICTQVDEYMAKLFDTETVWTCTLSDGTQAYQDDGRPDVDPPSAWERLGIYCKENDLHISKMILQNGTNVVTVGENLDGFYFRKTAGGFMFGDYTYHGFVAGTLNDGNLHVGHWTVPELKREWSENRDPNDAGISLIAKSTIDV